MREILPAGGIDIQKKHYWNMQNMVTYGTTDETQTGQMTILTSSLNISDVLSFCLGNHKERLDNAAIYQDT